MKKEFNIILDLDISMGVNAGILDCLAPQYHFVICIQVPSQRNYEIGGGDLFSMGETLSERLKWLFFK